jgi:hypothetical protein
MILLTQHIVESCIPVCTLQEAGDKLFEFDRSWLDAYHRPKVIGHLSALPVL